jgi:hypothetical protein
LREREDRSDWHYVCMYVCMYEVYVCMYVWMDGWMDVCIDGWMDVMKGYIVYRINKGK